LLASLTGCTGTIEDPAGGEKNPPILAASPAFEQVQAIFAQSCTGCHGTAGGLDLGPQAYANIVGVASLEDPSRQRVNPGHPESSYLYCKVDPTCTNFFGSRMPQGGLLGDPDLGALRDWILAGALAPAGGGGSAGNGGAGDAGASGAGDAGASGAGGDAGARGGGGDAGASGAGGDAGAGGGGGDAGAGGGGGDAGAGGGSGGDAGAGSGDSGASGAGDAGNGGGGGAGNGGDAGKAGCTGNKNSGRHRY
jgi:hypothetical protein